VRTQLITQLRYAIEEERQACRRYSEAADLAHDPKVEELLHRLASEEREHEDKLIRLLDENEAAPHPAPPPDVRG
jgi:rubrerythrin